VTRDASGRPRGEHRIGLQRELVVAQVRRLQRQRALDVVQRHRQVLAGQGVHQVEVDVVEAGVLRQLHRGPGLRAVVDPPEPAQAAVVETLDAQAQAIDAGAAVVLEAAVLGGAGVGFQRDLAARCETQACAGPLQQAVDLVGREQTRGAAAEEHAVHGPAPGQRQVVVQVGEQRVHVLREGRATGAPELVRVEVAVGTLAHAPGQVHVQRQGRVKQPACGALLRGLLKARPWMAGQGIPAGAWLRHGRQEGCGMHSGL
jgi:hypothetical protein